MAKALGVEWDISLHVQDIGWCFLVPRYSGHSVPQHKMSQSCRLFVGYRITIH
jgi:hypothetical protein